MTIIMLSPVCWLFKWLFWHYVVNCCYLLVILIHAFILLHCFDRLLQLMTVADDNEDDNNYFIDRESWFWAYFVLLTFYLSVLFFSLSLFETSSQVLYMKIITSERREYEKEFFLSDDWSVLVKLYIYICVCIIWHTTFYWLMYDDVVIMIKNPLFKAIRVLLLFALVFPDRKSVV